MATVFAVGCVGGYGRIVVCGGGADVDASSQGDGLPAF